MKRKYLIFIFFIFNGISFSQAMDSMDKSGEDNNWSEQIKEYKKETKKLKQDVQRIYDVLDVYQLDIVEKQYHQILSSLDKLNQVLEGLNGSESSSVKNEFYDLYEATLDTYDDLVGLFHFYKQLENKKEDWSNQYFTLWEDVYALKQRIDRNYVKEEKMNVNYGALSDRKVKSVYKRHIYEACSTYFASRLDDLKKTADCDHYERIQILQKMIPVLQKCDKLAYEEETRELEKELKRVEDPVVIRDSILGFDTLDE